MKGFNFLRKEEAKLLDNELLGTFSFDILQLIELAGSSCALIIDFEIKKNLQKIQNILFCCGPGDGLVCARHLKTFGYNPTVYYPNAPRNQNYSLRLSSDEMVKDYDLIVDALFGFGFSGTLRPPYEAIMQNIIASKVKVFSIDIPSGWDVDSTFQEKSTILSPEMIISLAVPKLCTKSFKGIHYLAGRFLPLQLITKYQLTLPEYPFGQNYLLLSNKD